MYKNVSLFLKILAIAYTIVGIHSMKLTTRAPGTAFLQFGELYFVLEALIGHHGCAKRFMTGPKEVFLKELLSNKCRARNENVKIKKKNLKHSD